MAYNQLLQSYRSLTLESMARSFGVSEEFVDGCGSSLSSSRRVLADKHPWQQNSELSRFIASGRLHCTIDKVHGVVETNRPAVKQAQYDTVVRQGDLLLSSVQRLSKVLY